ncbi:MAG TPA: site-specific integrase, partial [Gaiellaceae bacterium]|nr:site-specific integrase [Gaiellaceae bacterium]
GREEDGWNRRKAERELRHRLSDVERKGLRRPAPLTFARYADTWLEASQVRRDWRPSTVKIRRVRVGRLKEQFGPMKLAAIRPSHVAGFISEAQSDYAPATVTGDVDVLHDIFKTAKREQFIDANPAEDAERPKIPRKRWRILEPVEVARTAKAFSDEQARTVFLVLVLTGIRRGELQALRWRDVDLVESVLRVRDSKTEDGVRSIALPGGLAEAVWQWRRATPYQGDDERVFCNRKTGGEYREETFAEALRAALAAAKVEGYVRPFHDLRHTAITNDAASGSSPIAVMAKAGHASMATTKRYLHLAGVVFRDEADALERRLLGSELSTEVSTDLSASEST